MHVLSVFSSASLQLERTCVTHSVSVPEDSLDSALGFFVHCRIAAQCHASLWGPCDSFQAV